MASQPLRFAEQDLPALDALEVEALALVVAADERPLRGLAGLVDWRLCGKLSRVLKSDFFRGETGDSLLLPAGGRLPVRRIFVFGCGSGTDPEAVRTELARAFSVLERAGVTSVAFGLPLADPQEAAAVARECAQAFGGQAVLVVKDARRASGAEPVPSQVSAERPAERPTRAVPGPSKPAIYKGPRSMPPPKKPGDPIPPNPTPGADRPPHPTRRKGGR